MNNTELELIDLLSGSHHSLSRLGGLHALRTSVARRIVPDRRHSYQALLCLSVLAVVIPTQESTIR